MSTFNDKNQIIKSIIDVLDPLFIRNFNSKFNLNVIFQLVFHFDLQNILNESL